MTKEEVKSLVDLRKKFNEDVERVVSKLALYDEDYLDVENWSCRLIQLSWIMKDENQNLPTADTMLASIEFCKIPGKLGTSIQN